jgi:SAM-dependent methyltransferase
VQDSLANICPLCSSTGDIFYQYKKRLYYQCVNCNGIFVDKNLKPDRSAEKLRYEEHNNDVNDLKYQKFVSPITTAILENHKPTARGLDFGAGTGPVIAKILRDNQYLISLYDPFFHDNPKLLDDKYDYIACCEVIEHFHNPKKEFTLLKKLLKKGAQLYCMTDLYDESNDFHNWYYKNDLTHVFIYHKNTILWIQQEFGFSDVKISGRLIAFIH